MTYIKSIFVFLLLAASGCGSAAQQAIPPAKFQELINQQSTAQVVDVRTAGEFAGGHVKGAVNIDFRSASFAESIDKLDKTRPVFVYCLSCGRSASATKKLARMGYTEIYDMKGGMVAWKRAGLPTETIGNYSKPAGTSKVSYDKMIKADVPVLVNFYAPWCGPCRKMKPMLAELEIEAKGKYNFIQLNADENDALMKALDVTEIPAFFVYKDGEVTWQHIGLVEKSVLVTELGL